MTKVILFGGTTEGHKLANYLNKHKIKTYICVATEYGEEVLEDTSYLEVSHTRLDENQMESLFLKQKPEIIIDATHPYATVVTENIQKASQKTGFEYLRIVRPSTSEGEGVCLENLAEAINYLESTEGNILVTTGSKELAAFTKIKDYEKRVYARVLPSSSVVEECNRLGFKGKNLICMQGPFSTEFNEAMLKQIEGKYLVTKESGVSGGFTEKLEGAKLAGATPVIIGRPKKEEGVTLFDGKKRLAELFSIEEVESEQKIYAIGIGLGTEGTLTVEGKEIFQKADLVIGAKRMVESVAKKGQAVYYTYKAEEIANYIKDHPEYETVAIAYSGDVGFYSGAGRLQSVLPNVTYIPGISSVVYFAAKIGKSWDKSDCISLHGKETNIIGHLLERGSVYCLIGENNTISNIAKNLIDYGFKDVNMVIGQNLSYPNEKISKGKPEDFIDILTDKLSVLYLEMPNYKEVSKGSIPDEEFTRGKVPMTKEEIRTIIVGKLQLAKDSIVYDIGAGTGSVSIEMAKHCTDGMVYGIERNHEGVSLIEENKKRFKVDNISITEGLAPEALLDLPTPTHGFVGGSAGNLKEILQILWNKNPNVRVVISSVTLETVSKALETIKELPYDLMDVASVSVAKSKKVGGYHMMLGQNPVTIFTLRGRSNE